MPKYVYANKYTETRNKKKEIKYNPN